MRNKKIHIISIIIVISLLIIIHLFNSVEKIETTVESVVANYWSLIFVYLGILKFFSKEKNRFLSGIVLLALGLIILILNLEFFFFEEHSFLWEQFFASMFFLFFPAIFLLFIFSIFQSWWKSKEGKKFYFIFRRPKLDSKKWIGQDSVILSIFGGVNLELNTIKFNKNTIQFELISLFANVNINVPKEVLVTADNKTLFGKTNIINKDYSGLYKKGSVAEKQDKVEKDTIPPRLMIISKSFFSKININK